MATSGAERGRFLGVRGGRIVVTQIVVTQCAAVLVLLGAGRGTTLLGAAGLVAAALLLLAWLRWRGRWVFEWLATAVRYASRRHTVPVDAASGGVLRLATVPVRIVHADLAGSPAAVLVDESGVTAVLELGDPHGLLVEAIGGPVSPIGFLPPAASGHPPCRVQLLLTGTPAPAVRAGGGTPANSYRQLTDGRLLGHSRALLAVRVLHAEGFTEDDLHQALSGLVRRMSRRLGELPARPVGEAAVVRIIAEAAHHVDAVRHDDAAGAGTVRESWAAIRLGGLAQTTLRIDRWPDLRGEPGRRLIARMLALPATATTISLTAGPWRPTNTSTAGPSRPTNTTTAGPSRSASTATSAAGRVGDASTVAMTLTVRLAAADDNALHIAVQALRKLLADEHARARRLDGEHRDGLAATLPFGGGMTPPVPGRPAYDERRVDALEGLELPLGGGGLMLGSNRHGAPVVVRLFRPEQTRALVVGSVRCAQLITLRAMALGARVVVQTARPHAWEPFVRGAAVPGESIAVVAPGRVLELAAGAALHPLLVVVDVGPVGPDTRPGAGWQATLVVRDELTSADVDVAARADLLVLQPLRPEEAALAGTALGLGDAAQWLTRMREDMVGVINRRAVRWVALSPTPIESQLIGPPQRADAVRLGTSPPHG